MPNSDDCDGRRKDKHICIVAALSSRPCICHMLATSATHPRDAPLTTAPSAISSPVRTQALGAGRHAAEQRSTRSPNASRRMSTAIRFQRRARCILPTATRWMLLPPARARQEPRPKGRSCGVCFWLTDRCLPTARPPSVPAIHAGEHAQRHRVHTPASAAQATSARSARLMFSLCYCSPLCSAPLHAPHSQHTR